MKPFKLVIEGINPTPWKAPNMVVRRKGKKTFPHATARPEVVGYQEGLREYLQDHFEPLPLDGPIDLELHFWRNLAPYKRSNGTMGRLQRCDLSNLVKSTEDALQGLLFHNDKQVLSITASLTQEKDIEPRIAVIVKPCTPRVMMTFSTNDGWRYASPEIMTEAVLDQDRTDLGEDLF